MIVAEEVIQIVPRAQEVLEAQEVPKALEVPEAQEAPETQADQDLAENRIEVKVLM